MVEKISVDSRNPSAARNMKSSKKTGRGSMSNRHGKSTKVQNFGGFGGGSNSLNWRNDSPKNAAVNESNNYGYSNHYVANAFYSLIGLTVEIQKKDAIVYEGILETVSSKVEFHLSHACEKSNIDGTKSEKMAKKLIFPFSDVVYCRAPNVDIEFAKRDTLLTDTAISNTNGNYTERELVQWQPDDNGETFHDLGVGHLGDSRDGGWAFDDMMRVNEEEHGVKSTFDSSMSSYMTPLDKDNEEEFRAQERRAEQVAAAIQKDPKFKDVDNVDSGLGEEEMYSSVSRNTNNNNNNYNNIPGNHTMSNSPNSNDGFTTYTGKNYRGSGRHATQPASVVGPRLQRNNHNNNIRNQDGQNHTQSPGNHPSNRNHISASPQPIDKNQQAIERERLLKLRSQPPGVGVPSRNNSYPPQMNVPPKQYHQQQQQQQQPQYQRIDHHKVTVPNHHMPLDNNNINHNRIVPPQGDPTAVAAANTARAGLSYSAVAMKKDVVVNNNVNSNTRVPPVGLKQGAPPGMPDVVAQAIVPQEESMTQPPAEQQVPAAPVAVPPAAGGEVAPPQPTPTTEPVEKISQQPPWTPEALAAAKQQMIQEARKKASLGHAEAPSEAAAASQPAASLLPVVSSVTTTTVLSSAEATVITSSTVASATRQQPAVNQPASKPAPAQPGVPVAEKAASKPAPTKVEALEKGIAAVDIKSDAPVAGPKDARVVTGARGEENKQPFLMKYGRVQSQTAPEEKKGGSYKELKEFGEQFKLESKPFKKRVQKNKDQPPAKVVDGVPLKTPEGEGKSEGKEAVKVDAAKTEGVLVMTTVVTSSSVTVVSSINSAASTTVTSTTTTSTSEEPQTPSRKTSLNPAAKEFTLSATAKEFNPGRDSNSPFAPSPKQSPARQNSSSGSTPSQHNASVPYYHGGNQQAAVMIHPNGPEVISPTVQSVPMKQIYARPYISPGPGGSPAIQYSIPAFPNNNTNGPQIIAAPQSGFISQNPSGQQMIIIHPNEPYQQIVQPGQPGQQYYPMQQMIRCVPGHPNTNSVQQAAAAAAAARVPSNFQQDGSPGGYVLTAVSQHGGLVQHPGSAPPGGAQHQNYHPPPQSPGQSGHMQTQYAITHPQHNSQNPPQSPAQLTYTQGNNAGGPAGAFRSGPASMHSTGGQHHPQQPFVMVTHQGQHVQTVAVPNNQSYVPGQQYGGGILQNYQSGN